MGKRTCHKTARSLVEPVLKIQTLNQNQSQAVTTVIPTVTIGQGRATVLTALIGSGWEKTARSLATSVVRKRKREKRRRRKIFLRLTATIGIQRSARGGSRKDTAP